MNFGLICATLKEANVIIKDRRIQFGPKIQGYCFGKIEFEHFNIIIAISNIGPENAAKCCSLLIKYFSVDCVVNFGTCGTIDPTIEKGSVIIPDQLVFMGNSKQIIGSAKLSNKAQQTLQSYFTTSKCAMDYGSAVVLERTLASSTVFIASNQKQSMIRLGLVAVDMESFALAVTCSQYHGVPIAIIKVVVDTYGTNTNNFEDYLIEESNVLNDYGELPREVVWRCLNMLSDGCFHEK